MGQVRIGQHGLKKMRASDGRCRSTYLLRREPDYRTRIQIARRQPSRLSSVTRQRFSEGLEIKTNLASGEAEEGNFQPKRALRRAAPARTCVDGGTRKTLFAEMFR